MYEDFEIKTSYKYLKEVINSLKEPICILGGWAVFFQVNINFQKAQGRPYLGSRDIDLGFNIKLDISDDNLKKSSVIQSINILKKLKFKPLSFRLFKEVHTETEEEIQEGQIVPAHFIFPMYVDVIIDNISKNFKKIAGFNPIDEPLLRFVFENEKYCSLVKEFDKKLLLPSPELLLAMKINSLPNRSKAHKKVKDICDAFSLIWYSSINTEEIRITLLELTTEKRINICLKSITLEDLQKASAQINHSVDEIKRVLDLLK